MAVTRKGRLKCDICGSKQAKSGAIFMVVNGWALGSGYVWEDDGFDIELSEHYCSWNCLADRAFEQITESIEPLDITGD